MKLSPPPSCLSAEAASALDDLRRAADDAMASGLSTPEGLRAAERFLAYWPTVDRAFRELGSPRDGGFPRHLACEGSCALRRHPSLTERVQSGAAKH